jgi:nucleotide-binding universal stress UspA family protein
MRVYDTILLPTDGTPGSDAAIREAIGLADLTGATLHALYVVDDAHLPTEDDRAQLRGVGEAATGDVADQAAGRGVETVEVIEAGVPYEAILAYADRCDADLIVVGTHDRSGLDRFLLGSVAEKVVREATVPAMMVEGDPE